MTVLQFKEKDLLRWKMTSTDHCPVNDVKYKTEITHCVRYIFVIVAQEMYLHCSFGDYEKFDSQLKLSDSILQTNNNEILKIRKRTLQIYYEF